MVGFRSRAAAGFSALLLCACAHDPSGSLGSGEPTPTMRSALAQAACSHRVTEAEAWVDFMPGGGRNGRNLNVLAKLADPGAAALLIRSSASTPEMLVLEVRTADEAPILGQMSYREAAPEPLYRRISLTCRGGEIFAITAIERVY